MSTLAPGASAGVCGELRKILFYVLQLPAILAHVLPLVLPMERHTCPPDSQTIDLPHPILPGLAAGRAGALVRLLTG